MAKTTTTTPARRSKAPAARTLPKAPAEDASAAAPEEANPQDTSDPAPTPHPNPAPHPQRRRKGALVLAMLSRPEGASTAELMAATGWLPHSVRAAISTLRKDGIMITRIGRGADMRYIVEEAR